MVALRVTLLFVAIFVPGIRMPVDDLANAANSASVQPQSQEHDDSYEAPADFPVSDENGPSRAMPADWTQLERFTDDDGNLVLVVKGESFLEPVLAARDLHENLESAVAEVVDRWYRPGAGRALAIDADYILAHVVPPGRNEIRQLSAETGDASANGSGNVMHQGFAQIVLTNEFRAEADARWQAVVQRSRLCQAALLGGGLISVLIAGYIGMRLNQATRGFYTGRLQWWTAGVVTFLIVAACVIGRTFPWF